MKKRKVLSAVLAASLLASTGPATAWASEPNTEPVATAQASARSGELTVSGGAEGTDYEWQNNGRTLLVKGSGELTISGELDSNEQIVIKEGVTANLNFKDLTIINKDNFQVGMNAVVNIKCTSSTIAMRGEQNSKINIYFLNESSAIDNIVTLGDIILDGEDSSGYLAGEMTPLYGEIQAQSLEINGGSYDGSNDEFVGRITNVTINDGRFLFYGDRVFQSEVFNVHGGYFADGSYYEGKDTTTVFARADKYVIDGGTFVGNCDIVENTVWGCPVVDGKTLSYQSDKPKQSAGSIRD